MADYVPGTEEKDPKKVIMSLQQMARTNATKITAPTSTDNAAARFDGASGALQDSVLVVADTTGAISRTGNGGISVQGTNTNDSASAGYIGEIIESTVLTGAAVSLTTATSVDITSISLTAGDWDVWGSVWITPAGTVTAINCWVSTTATTEPTRPNSGGQALLQGISSVGSEVGVPVGMRRISVSATTTVYLGIRPAFSSTATGYGYIAGRRVR